MRPATQALYTKYAKRWLERWDYLEDLTASAIALYLRSRLKHSEGKTVATEASALRGLLNHCVHLGLIPAAPEVERVFWSQGTPAPTNRTRHKALPLSPKEVRAIINALPEWSDSKRHPLPIRARALVAYLTMLRPTTLSKLLVPTHWQPRQKHIQITADIDKEKAARPIPLTAEALKAIASVAPAEGQIFPGHRDSLAPYLKAAVTSVLGKDKAAQCYWQHFRPWGLTHGLEATGNIPGFQRIAGHAQATTTAKYIRPSDRAAADALRDWGPTVGSQRKRKRKT